MLNTTKLTDASHTIWFGLAPLLHGSNKLRNINKKSVNQRLLYQYSRGISLQLKLI